MDELLNPLSNIMSKANNDVINVIAKRIKFIGDLRPTELHKINQLMRNKDLAEIETLLSKASNMSVQEVDDIITLSASNNNEMSKALYEAKNKKQILEGNEALQSIITTAKRNMLSDVVNLSRTTAFLVDGKPQSIAKVYNNVINRAAYEVQTGITDYNTAMRQTIKNLSDSGLQQFTKDENGEIKVRYESGRTRRLDSAVRLNIQESISRFNQDYRKQQANEYGADVVFVSLHAMCALDHQIINGSEYTFDEFEAVTNSLERQIGTLNCKHFLTYGLKGISKNPYSDEDRKKAIDNSNKTVEYLDRRGKQKVTNLYDATQLQRQSETNIRKLTDLKSSLKTMGDTTGFNEVSKQIKAERAYYDSLSSQTGLSKKIEKLR